MNVSRALRVTAFALAALTGGSALAAGGPALVVELESGRVLHAERATDPWFPASITKLMTAYIIFQKLKTGQLKLDHADHLLAARGRRIGLGIVVALHGVVAIAGHQHPVYDDATGAHLARRDAVGGSLSRCVGGSRHDHEEIAVAVAGQHRIAANHDIHRRSAQPLRTQGDEPGDEAKGGRDAADKGHEAPAPDG